MSKSLHAVVPPASWDYVNDYTLTQEDCVLGGDRENGLNPGTDLQPDGSRCDAYAADLYERPLSQDGEDYYPWIDIVRVKTGFDATWFYYAIEVFDVNTGANNRLTATFGYEVDFDNDNRGDVYINVSNAGSDDAFAGWTQKDLFLFQDLDKDVGGTDPLTANDPVLTQNGYETQKFDGGFDLPSGGTVSDGVWVRVSPYSNPRRDVLEIAIKRDYINNPATAGNLRGWSTQGAQNEDQFYYHDYYNNAQIGDAYSDEPQYPPSNFYEGDNSSGVGEGLTLKFVAVALTVPSGLSTCPDTTITYSPINVKNDADGSTDTINFTSITSSQASSLELLNSSGTTVLATDTNGDGIWESVAPGADTDADGNPDTGDIAAQTSVDYQLRVTYLETAAGTDNLTINIASSNNSSVTANDTITTTLDLCADVSVTKTDTDELVDTYTPGTAFSFKITGSNAGPSASDGAIITDNVPTWGENVNWTCTIPSSSTATCPSPASGSGNAINVVIPTFPANSSVVITITGTYSSDMANYP